MNIIAKFNKLPKIKVSPIIEQIFKEINEFITKEHLTKVLADNTTYFKDGQIIMDLIDTRPFAVDNAARVMLLFASNGDVQIASVLIDYFMAYFKEKGYTEIVGVDLKREILTKGLPIPPEIRRIYKEIQKEYLAANQIYIHPKEYKTLLVPLINVLDQIKDKYNCEAVLENIVTPLSANIKTDSIYIAVDKLEEIEAFHCRYFPIQKDTVDMAILYLLARYNLYFDNMDLIRSIVKVKSTPDIKVDINQEEFMERLKAHGDKRRAKDKQNNSL